MPFGTQRAVSRKAAWQVEVGDIVGNLDSSARVASTTRDGDRVRLEFSDGTTHLCDANSTIPVVVTTP